MNMFDPELVAEFVTESSEHLADIENQLLEIESDGAEINAELVNTVFRGVHSIKGVAGFLGLNTINELSHSLEDVLNRIRNGELIPTSSIIDVMLKSADQLRTMVGDCKNSNNYDISSNIKSLESILNAGGISPATKNSADDLGISVDPVGLAEDVLATVDEELESTHVVVESANEIVQEEIEMPPAADSNNNSEAVATVPAPSANEQSAVPAQADPNSKAGKKLNSAPAETNIRVPVATLDNLMNLAGELVLNRNRLVQYSSRTTENELDSIASDFDQITVALQDSIMQTRMQTIGTVFGRFPRVVRDLSAKLGKNCTLVMEGKDVEVDKTIIEAMSDPLMHLVRNAVDHGMESPDQRAAAGKEANGTIRLSAYHRAGQVCIDIQDDGGGINPECLKEKAISKGIITQRQAGELSNSEALRLIFAPGFSTAEQLTDISGRGVGMDVVRTNIERIGGTVDVESQLGSGSTIHIVLPLTLAIIRSLIVECESRRFAIPQVNVAELVRVSEKEQETCISRVNGAVVFRLRGELLPLVHLSDIIDLGAEDTCSGKTALNVLVLETGRSRYGIVVDSMQDSEEIVVKPLGRHLKGCPSLAGATILGDGHVALILDISGIAEKTQLNGVESNENAHDEDSAFTNDECQKLLLFKNAPDEQFAIPMVLVTRIERMSSAQIEDVGGKLVTQYRGGMLPLIAVEDVVTANARPEGKHVSVVILEIQGHEFGVFAPTIEDIRDVPVEIDTSSLSESGVIGSQVIDGVTTRLLDIFKIVESCFPTAVEKQVVEIDEEEEDQGPKSILLAEDSKFFRKQVATFIREAGYEVVEADDGAEAWEKLQAAKKSFSVIVTDIEMPNMNGFEFCSTIRSSKKFCKLPVLALTSLASDKDIKNGMECGINEYQVKMNQDELIAAVHRLAAIRR